MKSMFPGKTLELRMINERSKLFNFLKGMAEASADAVFPVKCRGRARVRKSSFQ